MFLVRVVDYMVTFRPFAYRGSQIMQFYVRQINLVVVCPDLFSTCTSAHLCLQPPELDQNVTQNLDYKVKQTMNDA